MALSYSFLFVLVFKTKIFEFKKEVGIGHYDKK